MSFKLDRLTVFTAITVLLAGLMNSSPAAAQTITQQDLTMAREVIQQNTQTIPGFGVGSRVAITTGELTAVDALAIYLLKFHQQNKICPPIAVVGELLTKINDTDLNKKSLAVFWKEYSTTSDRDEGLDKADFLRNTFDWYIIIKQTERLKISNRRMEGYVASDEAWRKAMDSQRKSWERSTMREQEYILHRDANRVILNAEAAIQAAQAAVSSE